MASFLRDENLKNLTIDEETLTQLNSAISDRYLDMPEQAEKREEGVLKAFLFYIIRFDNKGYRVHSLEELLEYFRQAKRVERVIFMLESKASLNSTRNVGSYLELRLDALEEKVCFLTVSSDRSAWVDAGFTCVKDVLSSRKNLNGLARSGWAQFTLQIAGVFVAFLLSLWGASVVAPQLDVENSFFLTFLFILLLFSNVWSYVSPRVLQLLYGVFPSVAFIRPDKDKWHWLIQTIIGSVIVAVLFFLFSLMFTYIGGVLGEYFQSGGI